MPSLESVCLRRTAVSPTAPGFIGVLKDDVWYANEAKAKEAEERAKGEGSFSGNVTEIVTNSIGMKLALIPAGEFMIGNSESPEELRKAFKKVS